MYIYIHTYIYLYILSEPFFFQAGSTQVPGGLRCGRFGRYLMDGPPSLRVGLYDHLYTPQRCAAWQAAPLR